MDALPRYAVHICLSLKRMSFSDNFLPVEILHAVAEGC